MAYTDILNPTKGFDPKLGDSMCPNYGFDRERPSTLITAKPAGGQPSFREASNTGHSFTFSWLGRTRRCAQRIRQFAEQYERGCFTIIDWDNGGRHYVGRFTSIPKVTQAAYSKFDIQGAVFEEMPGMPMVEYPTQWDEDGVYLNILDDFGSINAATNGTWNQGVLPLDDVDVTTLTSSAANDWVQMLYRGYGFQVHLAQGRTYGQCQIYLDNALQTPVDSDGNVLSPTIDCYADQDDTFMSVAFESVPLNLHRVKVVALGTQNPASSGGTGVRFIRLKVMR